MRKKTFKYGLFILMLGFIFLPHYYVPFLQNKAQIFQAEALQGAYKQTKRPNFWPKKWLSGAYQKGFESYVRDRNAITPFAVRLNTQIDYNIFNTIAHHNILLGKHDQFYTKTDCEAYVGIDYKGKSWIKDKIQKLKYIIDFYEKKDIHFAVLVPAGKPGIFPENMPEYYQQYPIDSTNRKTFLLELKEHEIPHLSFDFLKDLKETTDLALFGEASLHWSHFAYTSTADSLRSFLMREHGALLPKLIRSDDSNQETPFTKTDKELVNGANFLAEPALNPMPHPPLIFEADSSLQKTRILSIGDSYYLSFYKNGIHDGLFDPKSSFLYYNHEVYPERMNNGKRVYAHDLDIISEIERSKLILLTVYETNLNRFGFNFIEKVYKLLKEEETVDQ